MTKPKKKNRSTGFTCAIWKLNRIKSNMYRQAIKYRNIETKAIVKKVLISIDVQMLRGKKTKLRMK